MTFMKGSCHCSEIWVYKESLASVTFKGKEGMEKMVRLIDPLGMAAGGLTASE